MALTPQPQATCIPSPSPEHMKNQDTSRHDPTGYVSCHATLDIDIWEVQVQECSADGATRFANMWTLVTVLIGGALAAAIGSEVYQLYEFCKPPVILAGDNTSAVVRWDLVASPALDIDVYLTHRRERLRLRSPQPEDGYIKVASFQAVPPVTVGDSNNRAAELQLPRSYFSNQTLYLLARATAGPEVVREILEPISKFVMHRDLLEPPRFLLLEPAKVPIETKAVASLPTVVELGFVQESRPLSRSGVEAKGLGAMLRAQELRLPLFLNALVCPRDEHVALIKQNAENAFSMEIRLRNVGLAYYTLQLQLSHAFDAAEQDLGLN
eukprot:2184488-Amphidinium_carterae.1